MSWSFDPSSKIDPIPPISYWGFPVSTGFPEWIPSGDRLMISAGSMWDRRRRRFHRVTLPHCAEIFLDSGGFTCLNLYGDYPWDRGEYLYLLYRVMPGLAATMDYPCEPDIHRGDRFASNHERIEATLENTAWLLRQDTPPQTRVLPVIQGYTIEEYGACIREMARRGITRDYMAVGSMCRRWDPGELRETMGEIFRTVESVHLGARLHWFGLKISALSDPVCRSLIYSHDTAAWSMGGASRYPQGREEARNRFFSYLSWVHRLKAKALATDQVDQVRTSITREKEEKPLKEAFSLEGSGGLIGRFEQLAGWVPPVVRGMLDRRQGILQEMVSLEAAGLTRAHPHWREGRYLYLIHPTGPDGRKREYIGSDPAKVDEALGKVNRMERYQELHRELAYQTQAVRQAISHLEAFFLSLDLAPHERMVTDLAGAQLGSVPMVLPWVTEESVATQLNFTRLVLTPLQGSVELDQGR